MTGAAAWHLVHRAGTIAPGPSGGRPSCFVIRKLAARKGLSVDGITKMKGDSRLVQFAAKGGRVDNPTGRLGGFALREAKIHLEGLPQADSLL